MKISLAGGLSLGDFLVTYIVPLIAFGLLISNGRGIFNYPELNALLVVYFVVVFLMLTSFLEVFSGLIARFFSSFFHIIPKLSFNLMPLFSILYLVAAIIYLNAGLSFSRYDGVSSASNLGNTTIVALIFMCKVFVSTQVFYLIAMKISSRIWGRYYWPTILCCLIITIDGMAHIMLLGIVIWFFLSERSLYAFVSNNILYKVKYKILAVIVVLFLFILGISFKSKNWNIFDLFLTDSDFAIQNLKWLLDRVSTLYFSAGFAINASMLDLTTNLTSWGIISNEIGYRFCVVFSDGCNYFQPEFNTMSRYNFANISLIDPGRGGASPGVVGSAAYISPAYISPFLILIYYSLVSGILKTVLNKRCVIGFTLIGLIVFSYLLRVLYLNPVSMLNPLSSPFIGFLIFILASIQAYQLGSSCESFE